MFAAVGAGATVTVFVRALVSTLTVDHPKCPSVVPRLHSQSSRLIPVFIRIPMQHGRFVRVDGFGNGHAVPDVILKLFNLVKITRYCLYRFIRYLVTLPDSPCKSDPKNPLA